LTRPQATAIIVIWQLEMNLNWRGIYHAADVLVQPLGIASLCRPVNLGRYIEHVNITLSGP